jgi:hypothetical protein
MYEHPPLLESLISWSCVIDDLKNLVVQVTLSHVHPELITIPCDILISEQRGISQTHRWYHCFFDSLIAASLSASDGCLRYP